MRTKANQIASLLQAIENCIETGNEEWKIRHSERVRSIVKNTAPSGSGFDSGTAILDESKPERLIFQADFHHMNENGFYDGWSEHKVIVTPSLTSGFEIRVTGRDRNEIKSYIAEMFHEWLSSPEEELAAATA